MSEEGRKEQNMVTLQFLVLLKKNIYIIDSFNFYPAMSSSRILQWLLIKPISPQQKTSRTSQVNDSTYKAWKNTISSKYKSTIKETNYEELCSIFKPYPM